METPIYTSFQLNKFSNHLNLVKSKQSNRNNNFKSFHTSNYTSLKTLNDIDKEESNTAKGVTKRVYYDIIRNKHNDFLNSSKLTNKINKYNNSGTESFIPSSINPIYNSNNVINNIVFEDNGTIDISRNGRIRKNLIDSENIISMIENTKKNSYNTLNNIKNTIKCNYIDNDNINMNNLMDYNFCKINNEILNTEEEIVKNSKIPITPMHNNIFTNKINKPSKLISNSTYGKLQSNIKEGINNKNYSNYYNCSSDIKIQEEDTLKIRNLIDSVKPLSTIISNSKNTNKNATNNTQIKNNNIESIIEVDTNNLCISKTLDSKNHSKKRKTRFLINSKVKNSNTNDDDENNNNDFNDSEFNQNKSIYSNLSSNCNAPENQDEINDLEINSHHIHDNSIFQKKSSSIITNQIKIPSQKTLIQSLTATENLMKEGNIYNNYDEDDSRQTMKNKIMNAYKQANYTFKLQSKKKLKEKNKNKFPKILNYNLYKRKIQQEINYLSNLRNENEIYNLNKNETKEKEDIIPLYRRNYSSINNLKFASQHSPTNNKDNRDKHIINKKLILKIDNICNNKKDSTSIKAQETSKELYSLYNKDIETTSVSDSNYHPTYRVIGKLLSHPFNFNKFKISESIKEEYHLSEGDYNFNDFFKENNKLENIRFLQYIKQREKKFNEAAFKDRLLNGINNTMFSSINCNSSQIKTKKNRSISKNNSKHSSIDFNNISKDYSHDAWKYMNEKEQKLLDNNINHYINIYKSNDAKKKKGNSRKKCNNRAKYN